jgi:hypothetical protein
MVYLGHVHDAKLCLVFLRIHSVEIRKIHGTGCKKQMKRKESLAWAEETAWFQ